MVDGPGGALSALLAQSRPQAGGNIDGTVGQPKAPQRADSEDGAGRVPPAPRGAGRGRLLDIVV